MGKFVTKIALVLCVVFGMAVGVSAEEAKAETKKANVFGSKAQNGWLKDFEYDDDYCWHFKNPQWLKKNKITQAERRLQCRDYLMEEVKLLIPYAEKKDGKNCNALEDVRIAKSDLRECSTIKRIIDSLSTSSYYNDNDREAEDILRLENRVLK